jgi:hypothetical protein
MTSFSIEGVHSLVYQSKGFWLELELKTLFRRESAAKPLSIRIKGIISSSFSKNGSILLLKFQNQDTNLPAEKPARKALHVN